MKWIELTFHVPPELVEPLTAVLRRYGGQAVAVEEPGGFNPDEGEVPPTPSYVTVRCYLPRGRYTRHRVGRIEVAARLLSLVQPMPPPEQRELEESEWQEAWKAGFQTLHVGRRLVIRPLWQEYTACDNEVVVDLDPGLAFGTGHHPTTRLCLEALEAQLRPGQRVLDLGTGSGLLAVAAARLGAAWVLALDTDPQAVRAARRNIRHNRLLRRVAVRRGTLPLPEDATFDLAVANISATVVSDLAGHLYRSLCPGGTLIASGFLRERQAEVVEAVQRAGLVLRAVLGLEDWVALVAQRPGG